MRADLDKLATRRILFSHHSVGENILDGLRAVEKELPGARGLAIMGMREAAGAEAPALVEITGGSNGDPKSKIDFFARTVREGKLGRPDLAFMKLCYVDFEPQTDVQSLFAYYRATIEALKRDAPGIRIAHSTVPLTVWASGVRSRVYRLIGKAVAGDTSNVRRAQFNALLKQTFADDPIYDLATIEATAPDGTKATFLQGGKEYMTLYRGYSEDGGHLNVAGQKVAAEAVIHFLAKAVDATPTN